MKQKFSDCIDRETMEEALKSLPESLEEMYADVLRRIPEGRKKKVRLILMWLAYSVRPLTLQELACAASLPDPQTIPEICTSSLVTVSREGPLRFGSDFGEKDIVKFDHFSVKKYLASGHLLASGIETAYFYANPLVAHLEIAQISVSYLLKTNKVDLVTEKRFNPTPAEDLNADSSEEPSFLLPSQYHKNFWLPTFPLLDYSVGWYRHVWAADAIEESTYRRSEKQTSDLQQTEGCADQESLRSQIHRLFGSEFSQSLTNWVHLFADCERDYRRFSSRGDQESDLPRYSPILIASYLNLPYHVQRLIGCGTCVDGDADLESVLAQLRTKPIYAAAKAGRLQVLKLLLENNAGLEQWEMDTVAEENEGHGVAVLSTILEARPHLAIENSTVVQSAMNYWSSDILRYTLDMPGPVTLTENLLVNILKNSGCRLATEEDLVEIILSRADGIDCDKHRILKVFLRESFCKENIRVVLDRYKPPPSMAQQVVKWAIGNRWFSDDVLTVVLKYYNDIEIEFSPEILAEVASYDDVYAIEMFLTILRHNKKPIAINDPVMAGIAYNSRGIYLMSLLMDHEVCREKDPLAIIDDFDRGAFMSHRDTCEMRLPLQMIEAAARWEPDTIDYLQAHARPNVTFRRSIAGTAPSAQAPDTAQR